MAIYQVGPILKFSLTGILWEGGKPLSSQRHTLTKMMMMMTLLYSMGVGRTGVFITLSIVLERMRYEGLVDVFQTVRLLWTQRPAIVQTEVCTS